LFPYGDITKISNLQASELDFFNNRIESETEFNEAWQENVEWYGFLGRHSLRRYCPLIWTLELRSDSIKSFGRTLILSWSIANAAEFNLI
jgi:hypothetical protein